MPSSKINDSLKEYRSALITAAVTGQIDVQTYTTSGTSARVRSGYSSLIAARETNVRDGEGYVFGSLEYPP
jgi:carbonic anhydrase/acetyltransferase-like protein (isoleucine patch superfamily)